MSIDNFKAKKANYDELTIRREKFIQRLKAADDSINEIARNLHDLEIAFLQLEKKAALDEIHIFDLDGPHRQIGIERGKLEAAKRIAALSRESINELERDISQSAIQVTVSRRDFCIGRRNDIFGEIKNDQKLKKKLLEAMAAYAGNGGIQFTKDRNTFINQFAFDILPQLSPEEIESAIESFKQKHLLD